MYALIFTCLTIRAVYITPLQSLDTRDIWTSFQTLMADCHVQPKTIFSDNTAQFRVIEESQPSFWTSIPSSNPFKQHIIKHSIKWNFIHAKAPWYGGAYERLIQTIKTSVYNTMDHTPQYISIFTNTLKHTQTIVNLRPLHAIYKDPHYEDLTSSHFFTPELSLVTLIPNEPRLTL